MQLVRELRVGSGRKDPPEWRSFEFPGQPDGLGRLGDSDGGGNEINNICHDRHNKMVVLLFTIKVKLPLAMYQGFKPLLCASESVPHHPCSAAVASLP